MIIKETDTKAFIKDFGKLYPLLLLFRFLAISFLLIPSFFFGSTFLDSSSDRFQFGILWDQIKPLDEKNTLKELIEKRRLDIKEQKEYWRPFTLRVFEKNQQFFLDFNLTVQEGSMSLIKEGSGSAYFIYKNSSPYFVVKPTDEDIFCLNNSKHFASPFIDPKNRVRKDIPLYLGAQTEMLCYEIAKLAHLEHTLPQTVLSILSFPEFFDISERLSIPNQTPDKEKLCSIQKYLENTLSLKDLLNDFFLNNFDETKIKECFDQEDFADANLLLWITYDNDAHPSNFRVYPKKTNDDGLLIYGLQKIDNTLCFPQKNSGFFNALMYFPNALEPISFRIRSLIRNFPIEEMIYTIEELGLSASVNAFQERMDLLRELIKREDITYYECNLRLMLLEQKELEEVIQPIPIEKLESLVIKSSLFGL